MRPNTSIIGQVTLLVPQDPYGVAQNVSCEFYLGRPNVSGEQLTLPQTYLGTEKLDIINELERKCVTLRGQKLTKPIYVTVKLSVGKLTDANKDIYWGVPPPEELFTAYLASQV